MVFLKDCSKVMQEAKNNMSSADFKRIGKVISDIKSMTREQIQKTTSQKIKNVIQKLKENKPLTKEELNTIRLWIVGDADTYIKMENNFQDWLSEFKRLEGALVKYENKELSCDELFKLQGILEDALRVSSDIANFLEKKERVEKFEQASKDTASLDSEVLAKILAAKLDSPEI
jgi:hypothetical protein